jgi:hypothetical protein
MGHAMTENRHGPVVETGFTQATGTAEREEAKAMIERHSPGSTRRLTVGADKAYDTGRLRRRPQGHVRDAARRPEDERLGDRCAAAADTISTAC